MDLTFFRRLRRPRPESTGDSILPSPPPTTIVESNAATSEVPGLLMYDWLLSPKMEVVAYRMRWHPRADQREATPAAMLQAAVNAVGQGFNDRSRGWLMAKTGVIFDVTPESAAAVQWGLLSPKHAMLCWNSKDLQDCEAVHPLLLRLRDEGFRQMVSGPLPEDKRLCDLLTHYDVEAGDPLLLQTAAGANRRGLIPVASVMNDWDGFRRCAQRTPPVPVLVPPHVGAPPSPPGRELAPETVLLVRLLQMVQRNRDVQEIEAALKHDAALTYRLLRKINTSKAEPAFEIMSVKHAVAMLGYSRLFRFLSELLTQTEAKWCPPFLMKKAIIRGRFVELLGHQLLGAQHADNLFLVGMFSVVNQLLGVSMDELLKKVQLTAAVQVAIRDHSGLYGPLLALTIACESDPCEADHTAEALFMSTEQVNAAHLAAIVWAQDLSRSEAMY